MKNFIKTLLKNITYITAILLVILLIYLCIKVYNIDYVSSKAMMLMKKVEHIKAAFFENLKEVIHSDNFKKKYLIKTSSGENYDVYYVKVLCDENFLKWFIDSIPWAEIISEKTTNQEKFEKISALLNSYINNKPKVLSDFVYYTIQKNAAIGTKTDPIVVLKEYASLITMSTKKLNMVISTRFLKNFLTTLNITDWETYKNSEDFMVNHMSLLKQQYYYAISHYRVETPNDIAMNYLLNFYSIIIEKGAISLLFFGEHTLKLIFYNIPHIYSIIIHATLQYDPDNFPEYEVVTPGAFAQQQKALIIANVIRIIVSTPIHYIIRWKFGIPI